MTTGGYISPSRTPNAVVRVYLPPFDQWEKRTGSSLGVRADVIGTFHKNNGGNRGFFRRPASTSVEPFWPGFFIQFNSKTDGQNQQDSATILVRANEYGQDIPAVQVTQTGWWSLGMTFTSGRNGALLRQARRRQVYVCRPRRLHDSLRDACGELQHDLLQRRQHGRWPDLVD